MTEKQEAAVRALVEASKPAAVGHPAPLHDHPMLRIEALRLACGDNCTVADGSDTLAIAAAYARFLIGGEIGG